MPSGRSVVTIVIVSAVVFVVLSKAAAAGKLPGAK